MRYVSGVRSLATDDDLRQTIVDGLNGVSMPNHRNLSTSEVDSIVRQVRRFQKAGLTSKFQRASSEDSQQLRDRWIEERLQDTQAIAIDEPDTTDQKELSLSLGRRLFHEVGCVKCHPLEKNQGIGTVHFDSVGRQIQPRRFGRDPLKRVGLFREIYARISLGIPGTPHSSLSPDGREKDLEHLVLFVQSIQEASSESKLPENSTNYSRFLETETTPQPNP
jgi:hypothetical protein